MKTRYAPWHGGQASALGALLGGAVLLSRWTSPADPAVPNGNFENPLSSGPANWRVVYVVGGPSDFAVKGRTTAARYGGSGYGGAFKPFHDAPMHAYFTQTLSNLTAGARYAVTNWMNKRGGGDEGWYPKVRVYAETIGGLGSVRSAEATNVYRAYVVTNTANAQGRLEIQLHFDKWAATSGDKWFYIDAWFDDVSLGLVSSNHPPVAHPQSLTLNEDTPTPLTLSASDPDGDPLTWTITAPPAHGTLSGTAPNVVYSPSPNYNGPDSFAFKVNDGLVDSAPATVSLTVLPVNDPPVAQSQAVALDEDTTAAITLLAFDVDGDPLAFTVGAPAHGTLSGTPPNLVYRPATNYFGPDEFTFFVSDGQATSAPATVSLTVRPVNDPPVASLAVFPLAALPGVTNLITITPPCTNAWLVLDGSASSDVEHDPLDYTWLDGTNVIASGVTVTNEFAPGTHVLTLLVSDGQATGGASLTVEVLRPAEAVALLMAAVEEADLGRRNERPLLATLRAAAASFERCNLTAALNQLGAFRNKVRAQVAPFDAARAEAWIQAAAEIGEFAAGQWPAREQERARTRAAPAFPATQL